MFINHQTMKMKICLWKIPKSKVPKYWVKQCDQNFTKIILGIAIFANIGKTADRP